ncbi:hypothetical protein [Methylobacterium tarhaniae]|uniref:hypothetical protein n=1 Tax=Methylobacterium tarhaniae TaxID=1187852 RepID=UPI0012EE45D2|nr:hypothetical protein [Methylobacterium tarhaniae]
MTLPRLIAAERGACIGLTRGRHEMDRDAAPAPTSRGDGPVPAENALEALSCTNRFKACGRAGRVTHAGPGASPGAKLDRPLPPGWRLSADGDRLAPRDA